MFYLAHPLNPKGFGRKLRRIIRQVEKKYGRVHIVIHDLKNKKVRMNGVGLTQYWIEVSSEPIELRDDADERFIRDKTYLRLK